MSRPFKRPSAIPCSFTPSHVPPPSLSTGRSARTPSSSRDSGARPAPRSRDSSRLKKSSYPSRWISQLAVHTAPRRILAGPLRGTARRELVPEVPALLQHPAQRREAEALEQRLEPRERALQVEIVAEALPRRRPLARLRRVELPGVQVERRRPVAALERADGGPRECERQQPEVPSAPHRQVAPEEAHGRDRELDDLARGGLHDADPRLEVRHAVGGV